VVEGGFSSHGRQEAEREGKREETEAEIGVQDKIWPPVTGLQ
jgi:hypothetical protein